MAPGEVLPGEDDPPTAASVLVGMLGRPILARLRGEPAGPWRDRAAEEERRRSEAEARKKAARYAAGARVMAQVRG